MPEDQNEDALARDMIEVHGREASVVARANVRIAARTGAIVAAKRWIRVLEAIQRQPRTSMSAPNTFVEVAR